MAPTQTLYYIANDIYMSNHKALLHNKCIKHWIQSYHPITCWGVVTLNIKSAIQLQRLEAEFTYQQKCALWKNGLKHIRWSNITRSQSESSLSLIEPWCRHVKLLFEIIQKGKIKQTPYLHLLVFHSDLWLSLHKLPLSVMPENQR